MSASQIKKYYRVLRGVEAMKSIISKNEVNKYELTIGYRNLSEYLFDDQLQELKNTIIDYFEKRIEEDCEKYNIILDYL